MKTMPAKPYRAFAFTLLEALLSAILAAMIAVLILAAYNATVKNGGVLLKKSERQAQLQYAMDQLRADLANLYRCPDWQCMFLEGQSRVPPREQSDRIVFYAMREHPTPEGVGWEGPCRIEYGIIPDSSGALSCLARRCGPIEEGNFETSPETITVLAADIQEFYLEYLDQEQWVNDWQKKDAFPTLIRITLVGRGGDSDATPISISQVVSLTPLPVFAASPASTFSTEPATHETPPGQ